MNSSDILHRRLSFQHLNSEPFTTPQAVVRHFGAVQAQEYADAKWALGLRLGSVTEDAVEKALDEGDILRTHIMRPTWHFVTPDDIRWLTALTAPRVKIKMAYYERLLELSEDVFSRSRAALTGALSEGKALTRKELGDVLEGAGVPGAKGQRLGHLLIQMELEALITSGPRRGKGFTYMLLEERVPAARELVGEEALGELTRRYFGSHGPATPQDFAWWSGLTVADAKQGLELLGSELEREVVRGQTYAFAPSSVALSSAVSETSATMHLLPWFDEYTVAYKDRAFVFGSDAKPHMTSDYDNLSRTVLLDGRAVAFWKRTVGRDSVSIDVRPFRALSEAEKEDLQREAERFRRFLGVAEVDLNGIS